MEPFFLFLSSSNLVRFTKWTWCCQSEGHVLCGLPGLLGWAFGLPLKTQSKEQCKLWDYVKHLSISLSVSLQFIRSKHYEIKTTWGKDNNQDKMQSTGPSLFTIFLQYTHFKMCRNCYLKKKYIYISFNLFNWKVSVKRYNLKDHVPSYRWQQCTLCERCPHPNYSFQYCWKTDPGPCRQTAVISLLI